MEELSCPKCGAPSEQSKVEAEECIVPLPSEESVLAVARNFNGTCMIHGRFIQQRPTGHHSTVSEKQLKRLFTKVPRERLFKVLNVAERKLHGRRLPKPGDVDRWLDVLRQLGK